MKPIPTDRHITYQLQQRRCGKPSCTTCKNGSGHGPYWYAFWRNDANRLCSGYIGKTLPDGLELDADGTVRRVA